MLFWNRTIHQRISILANITSICVVNWLSKLWISHNTTREKSISAVHEVYLDGTYVHFIAKLFILNKTQVLPKKIGSDRESLCVNGIFLRVSVIKKLINLPAQIFSISRLSLIYINNSKVIRFKNAVI